METIADLLLKHNFFSDLKPAQLEFIAGCGKNVHFKKGSAICKEGTDADYFYVIRHGLVALEIHGAHRGTIRMQTIGDNEILGWSWLIPPHKWTNDAVALNETSAIALDGKCLRGKCESDHELGYELLKRFSGVLARRLEMSRIQLLDVYKTPSV